MLTSGKRMGIAEVIFILTFMAYYIVPVLAGSVSFMIPLLIGAAYVLLIALKSTAAQAQSMVKYILIILSVAFIYFIFTQTQTINENVSYYNLKRFLSKFYQQFIMFLPVVFLLRIVDKSDKTQQKALLLMVLIMFLYVLLNTYSELLVNALATRQWSNFAEQSAENVGTYGFIYAVAALFPILLRCFLVFKGLLKKLAVLAALCFLFAFLLKAQYTLALLIALIGSFVVLFSYITSRIYKLILAISFPFAVMILPILLQFMAGHIQSEQISIRLQEIAIYFQSGDASGYNLNGRLTLYANTIKAFLSSPIIGNKSLDFDGHATFLTVLAGVGLLGGIPFYYLYFSMKNRVYDILGIQDQKYLFFPTFLSLLLIGFTNPIQGALPLSITVWFLSPLILRLLPAKAPSAILQTGENDESIMGNRRPRTADIFCQSRTF